MEFIELATELAAELIELTWDPLAKRISYLKNMRGNIDNLKREAEGLSCLRDDVLVKVERAEGEGKFRSNVVNGWLERTQKIINDKRNIEEEYNESKKCFNGWCLDCPSRYKLGKHIVKTTQAVIYLKEKGEFDEVDFIPLLQSVQPLPTTTIKWLTSAAQTQEKIWEWLLDAKVGRIGIWGMGGVGKTTILRNINNKLHGPLHFDIVVFVTVSKDWNMRKLRNDIGKQLSFNLQADDEDNASRILFAEFKKKKFLLILDDLWEKVDLDKLGVPHPTEHNGCKIALTTRSRSVCNDMETDEEIMVEVLPEAEAWDLFHEKAGDVVTWPAVQAIAREVCRECHGLPLALTVVGRAMRKKEDVNLWEHVLGVLRSAQFELRGMEDDLYSPLKVSYEGLENDTLRDCFLSCSIFPQNDIIDIDRLIEYWTMEGLLGRFDGLKDASAKGHYLLSELIDSCLLEKHSSWNAGVQLHDVIRDMAIKITSEGKDSGCRFLVRTGVGLDEWVDGEKWKGMNKISLMENDIVNLPDRPNCPNLSTLLLQRNYFLQSIPDAFFYRMPELRVLDLSLTNIESLPRSICKLYNLRVLILRECFFLKTVNHVRRLQKLQILDLRYTIIGHLPDEIGELTSLRRLNLSCTHNLVSIQESVISRLSLLEDLEMEQSFYFRHGGKESSIRELGCLKHLNHLSLDVTDHICAIYLFQNLTTSWKRLSNFYLRVGPRDPMERTEYIKDKKKIDLPQRRGKCLDLTQMSGIIQGAEEIINHAVMLCLYNQIAITNISQLGLRNMNGLKECWVWECERIESVVSAEEAEPYSFPCLEVLVLSDLPNMKSIWEGNVTTGSLQSIKRVILQRCPMATYLFASGSLNQLQSLEELEVRECDGMGEIILGNVGEGTITLPKLSSMILETLPNLKSIWVGNLALPSLQEITIINCKNLETLPLAAKYTPALEVIVGDRECWEGLEWADDSSKLHFQTFFKPRTHDAPSSSSNARTHNAASSSSNPYN